MNHKFDSQPLLFAITGSIGAGKSSVAELLAQKGVELIDADKLAREVTADGQPALEKIKENFGGEVFEPDGSLNRRALGKIVFVNKQKKELLESILHPLIRDLAKIRIENAKNAGTQMVAYVVPLLFESSLPREQFKTIVSVLASDSIRKKRLAARDNLSDQEIEARMNSQLPQEFKAQQSDFVIINDGSRVELEQKVLRLYEDLLKLASGDTET